MGRSNRAGLLLLLTGYCIQISSADRNVCLDPSKHSLPARGATFSGGSSVFSRVSYLVEESLKQLQHRPADLLHCERESNGRKRICTFVGPVQGFLPACIEGPDGGCLEESTLEDALDGCRRRVYCGGITAVGRSGHKSFVLSYTFNLTQPSEHGTISFLKACSSEDPKVTDCILSTLEEQTEPAEEPTFHATSWPYHPKILEEENVEKELPSVVEELDVQVRRATSGGAGAGGYRINGKASIFVGIASYRDELCRATVEDALEKAAFPDRLVFGIVEQNVEGDIPCVPTDCNSTTSAHGICAHLEAIRIYRVSGRLSRGPTWARHRVHKLYRGETFSLQIDAHMLFVLDWDKKLVEQWESLENEMAVLSSYPTDVLGGIDQVNARSLRSTRPMMCEFQIVEAGLVRFDAAIEVELAEQPTFHPFWAAGMSFSRGHFVTTVPYDCCSPDLFMGEEIGMTVRAFTHGYDIYAPSESLVFHYTLLSVMKLCIPQYPPSRLKGVPLFWENHKKQASLELNSMERIRFMLGLDGDDERSSSDLEFDRTTLESYGLGTRRPADLFFELYIGRTVINNLCEVTLDGFLGTVLGSYLRMDGQGIDYDQIDIEALTDLLEREKETDADLG